MAQNAPLLLKLVATSISAANRAGKIIRDVMTTGDLGIIEKGKNDIQTEADRSAQRCIIASLSRQFPSLTIIGEEGESSENFTEVPSDYIVNSDELLSQLNLKCPENLLNVQMNDICVWVDPLDGTNEYTKGLFEHITVLIGISVNGEPVAGVIHQPYAPPKDKGRTIWGIKGAGVGGFEPISNRKDHLVIVTTRSHPSPIVDEAIQALKPDEVLRVGGAGYKIICLLEGKANLYLYASAGCKKWDTCAPQAVLEALGGKLTDIFGRPYPYDKNANFMNAYGVLATAPGETHEKFAKMIPESVKEFLNQSK